MDPLPVNRMPLPDDWRGILQFQAAELPVNNKGIVVQSNESRAKNR